MNSTETRYTRHAIVEEMLETIHAVRQLDVAPLLAVGKAARRPGAFFAGEGSSRIFPAKNSICTARRRGYAEPVMTEGCRQAMEYDLSGITVFVASNSGRTREAVELVRKLKAEHHGSVIGVAANAGTPVLEESDAAYLLSSGAEHAVAATKSVIEQALFYDLLLRDRYGATKPDLAALSDALQQAMTTRLDNSLIDTLASAGHLFFAGRNDGVAEELTLKTNEIVRKRSAYLEGTYVVHGIEEVMQPDDVVVLVEPFPEEEEKIAQTIEKGVGAKVIAVGSRKTRFPTFIVPDMGEWNGFVQLAAGWNLLVDTGIALGIDIDKPQRARKIGNEINS